jgi:hypothetical protein
MHLGMQNAYFQVKKKKLVNSNTSDCKRIWYWKGYNFVSKVKFGIST